VDLEPAKPAHLVPRMLARGESGRGCIVGASAKSGKGRRVRLTWAAVTALKDHRNRQLEERMRLDGLWQDYNEIGCPSTPPTCVTAPASASRRASVRKDLHSMISAIRAPILAEGVTLARVGAAALSLALTGALLAPTDGGNNLDREPGAFADAAGDDEADDRCRDPDRRRLVHTPGYLALFYVYPTELSTGQKVLAVHEAYQLATRVHYGNSGKVVVQHDLQGLLGRSVIAYADRWAHDIFQDCLLSGQFSETHVCSPLATRPSLRAAIVPPKTPLFLGARSLDTTPLLARKPPYSGTIFFEPRVLAEAFLAVR